MSWLSDFFGGSDNSKSSGTEKGTKTGLEQTKLTGGELQSSSQQTGAVTATDQETQSTQQQTTLDPETQAQLRQIISQLSEQSFDPNGLSQLLSSRAANADAAYAGNIAPILAGARQGVERNLAETETALKSAAGSGLNTAVMALSNRARGDAETSLARLAAELGIQTRGAATSEIQGALQGESLGRGSVTRDIASLASILKGANVQQTSDINQGGRTETQETINQQTELQRLLEEFAFSAEEASGSSFSKTKGSGDSLLDWIGTLGSLDW